ncbi:hypothetical protein [Kibdelosporangium aridum]|uniref:hypothetical protein n=1 Tax=Kibdelosporangium aridum TaxID=2030 RepID=UPI00068BED1D
MVVRDGIGQPWGSRTPYGAGQSWPVRVDSYLADGVQPEEGDTWVRTAAVLHSNGDGMDLAVKDGRIVGVRVVGVRGRADDRVNQRQARPEGLVRVAGQQFR